MAPKNPENNESKSNQAPENNSPQFEIDKSQEAKKKSRNIRIGAIACLVVVAGIAGFIVKDSFKNNTEPSPEPSPQETFDEASNSQEPNTEQPIPTVNTYSESPVESPSETTETVVSQSVESYLQSMDQYKSIDVDTFETLPRSTRLSYAQFLMDLTAGRNNYKDTYSGKYAIYAIKPVVASLENSGQDILDIFLYASQMSYLQFVEGEDVNKPYDPSDGQKLLSASYYEVGKDKVVTNDYLVNKDYENTMSEPLVLNRENIIIKTSDIIYGNDREGKKVQYKILYFTDESGSNFYASFVYCDFVNYDGKNKSTWLLYGMAKSEAELSIPIA